MPCARGGGIANSLAAALLTKTKFAPHRTGGEGAYGEEVVLRETAKLADLAYSDEAMRSFELFCDGIVYFCRMFR